MLSVITISLLLSLISAQSASPRDVYETSLKTIITSLQTSLARHQQSLKQTLALADQFHAEDRLANEVLKQGINNFRTALRNTINQTSIPYNLVTWKCNSTSFDNYNKIASNNQQVLVNQKSIERQLSSLAPCPQVTEIKSQFDLLQKETNVLQSQFKYLCPVNETTPVAPPIAPNQQWVSNLDNPSNNWIYGKTNPKDYYDQVNALINKGAQLCPATTPYVNVDNHCINCQYIYDVNLKNCVTCPPNSKFNQSIHQCDSSNGETVLKNSNPQVQNYIGKKPDLVLNLTTCPKGEPFFNGTACITCQLPNYFDFSKQVCLTCGKDKKFSVEEKECKPINNTVAPQYTAYNSNLSPNTQNYVGTPPTQITTASSCPERQPFFNGMNCISCTIPLYFNFTSKVCETCNQAQMFDSQTKKCVTDPNKVYYTSSLNGVSNYAGSPPNIPPNNDKKVIGCPIETPFSNGHQCLACPLPRFYNFQTNQCQLCSSQLTFDINTKSCAPKTTTSTSRNSNIEKSSNFMGRVPLYNSSLLTCPEGSPYFNGVACTTCQLPSYFNFQVLVCQTCPQGLHFNVHNRLCEYEKPSFVTDTTNQNILFNGNYSQVVTEAAQKKQQFAAPTCPNSAPFYDSTKNICISCPGDNPIFNIKYSRCVNCGGDSVFDKMNRICISRQRIAPTLERTLMNTFRI